MAYNNPEASGVDMPPTLIVRIFNEVEGVVAIKECSGDARRIPALINASRRSSRCSSAATTGRSRASRPARTGWVTGVGVVAPRETVELYEPVQADDLARRARVVPLACCRSPTST